MGKLSLKSKLPSGSHSSRAGSIFCRGLQPLRRTLLFALMCVGAQGAYADDVTFKVRSWNSIDKQVVTTTDTRDSYVLYGSHPNDWKALTDGYYVVEDNVEYKVLTIQGNDVHLILADNSRLDCKHIKLEGTNKLYIHSQSDGNDTGVLNVDSREGFYMNAVYLDAAAIGSGGESVNMGSLYIHGGKVIANSGTKGNGAAIGGGYKSRIGGEVVVLGGYVDAVSGSFSAAIGGGRGSRQGGPVIIYGGTVHAYAGSYGAGIGGGDDGDGGTVAIHGGAVIAKAAKYGTGIGGGDDGQGGNVSIYGGDVVAVGGMSSFSDARPAIGGVDADHGQLNVGNAMQVRAGTNSQNVERVFKSAERETACHSRPWARISVCYHTPQNNDPDNEVTTYTIVDSEKHQKHCAYCKTVIDERHDISSGSCVCGIDNEGVKRSITLYVPGTTKDTYVEGNTHYVAVGKKFMLPDCTTVPDGYIFAGWQMNADPQSANYSQWAALNGDNIHEAGSFIDVTSDVATITLHARFLYAFTVEWIWDDSNFLHGTSVIIKHRDCTTQAYPVGNHLSITSAEMTYESGQTGTRYEATCTHTLNGYTYTFADVYDDITPTDITIADDADNTATLTANDGRTANVTLSGRTLYKDGSWNTLCLPFDVPVIGGTPLQGATVKALQSTAYDADSGTLTFLFTTGDLTALSAGMPYLVMWEKGTDVSDPVFERVVLNGNEGGCVGTQHVDFAGCFSPVALKANDRSLLYLGDENTLYFPSADITVGACRAIFHLNGLTASDLKQGARSIVLHFGDGEETSISEELRVKSEVSAGAWYDLQGRRLNSEPTTPGLYINNGKKVVMK